VVGSAGEIPVGGRKLVTVGTASVGVLNVGGRLFAVRNSCPHRGAPICLGHTRGTMMVSAPQQYVYDETRPVLRCPWHGYEFALEDGTALYDPDDLRVLTYPVAIEGGDIVVYA
jgi:nitrite reductase/ring-hydroxylating ferredoxin subunit